MQMNDPRVSILISAYKHERYVEDCVRSVLAQTRIPILS